MENNVTGIKNIHSAQHCKNVDVSEYGFCQFGENFGYLVISCSSHGENLELDYLFRVQHLYNMPSQASVVFVPQTSTVTL